MRIDFYRLPLLVVCSLAPPLALLGQSQKPPEVAAPGVFETQGSVTVGYRFTDFTGREEKFLELFDLQKGFRVMDFNLLGQASEGSQLFADSFSLTASGMGGDPYSGGQFTMRKEKLYDLRVNYRQSYYYWDRNDGVLPPAPSGLPQFHNLTTNHNWASVRRFASANLTVHATNSLRFLFEYGRTSRRGVNFNTRTLEYFGMTSVWESFLRANPYYVEAPLYDHGSRFTGGLSYAVRDWNFHYRLGYQSFRQVMDWHNASSPQRSINIDTAATANETVDLANWMESRRLKTPVSEFSFNGRPNRRLDFRGGYIFYRYKGPASMQALFDGRNRTSCVATACAPYTVEYRSHAELTEPNHVADGGVTVKIKDWWNLHADYRYSRFAVDSMADFHSLRDRSTEAEGEEEFEWKLGTRLLDVNMEFLPTRGLVVRPGIRYLKRDIQVLADRVIDDARTRRINTVWPTLSAYFQPSRKFSVRGDFQSVTNGASYSRISPHTDIGSRFMFRFRPTEKLTIEDNLVFHNRKFQDTDYVNNLRLNAFNVSYDLHERFGIFGGFSYDSFFATASVIFLRGTEPRSVAWRDQTVNRVWQAGVAVKPHRSFGVNLSGNFVRTTGAGEISGEPPYFGPLTWPLATGSIYYDFPKLGRLAIDLQRTYYIEEIIRGNDFRANLLTIRWTRDF